VKNRFILPAVLLCLALVFAAAAAGAEETAPSPAETLQIRKAAYDPESGVLTVTWIHTGSIPVTGAEIRINPLDADGNAVLIGEGYMEEILEEERVLHTSALSEPGKEVTVSFTAGEKYPAAAGMEIAFDRIEASVFAEDGTVTERTVLEVPDNRMHWYSTLTGSYAGEPESREPYSMPSDEVFARGAEISLGISTIPVTGEVAAAYGFMHSGVLIIGVEEGSAAEDAGLEPGDLIFSANGISYAEEPFMMALAAAELASGGSTVMMLERDNETLELSLSPADE